jgi:hypothetical protein
MTGLSDKTFKTKVPCHNRHLHEEELLLLNLFDERKSSILAF